jgi:hypothetical protein
MGLLCVCVCVCVCLWTGSRNYGTQQVPRSTGPFYNLEA